MIEHVEGTHASEQRLRSKRWRYNDRREELSAPRGTAGVTAPYKPKLKPTYVKAKTQPKTTTELSTRGSDILRKTRNSFKRNTGDHIIERVKRANNKTINEAKQMQVRIRKGKQGKYALTHINYDITHGHLEVLSLIHI